jgi:D-lactate dehydrogenase (cytochrome)
MVAQTRITESFLTDASLLNGGNAAQVIFPETTEDVAEILRGAASTITAVTVSGAGTGLVGGRVPAGGIVLATNKLNRIYDIAREGKVGRAKAEAGVVLSDFQRAVESERLFYPPDPTERSCFLGATVATNSSGARTFKYGATREWIRGLKIVLPTGDIIELKRGEIKAGRDRIIRIPLSGGREIRAPLPNYRMPQTRKHAAGYFVAPRMDAIDLFIGSEGTLGIVTEVETSLIPLPENILGGIVFFDDENRILDFVSDARSLSFRHRAGDQTTLVDARALEYFDNNSLDFLRTKHSNIPREAKGAIFFEQEITVETSDALFDEWMLLLQKHGALIEESWFAIEEKDRARLRGFRHDLPVMINEWLTRHNQRKISTDLAVPDAAFPAMMDFYKQILSAANLHYVIFGHIGDNHVHVNIMPRSEVERETAQGVYKLFTERAIGLGGTVSAEHGIGKIKRESLRMLYGEEGVRQMRELKRAFDPDFILGQGNIIVAGE